MPLIVKKTFLGPEQCPGRDLGWNLCAHFKSPVSRCEGGTVGAARAVEPLILGSEEGRDSFNIFQVVEHGERLEDNTEDNQLKQPVESWQFGIRQFVGRQHG